MHHTVLVNLILAFLYFIYNIYKRHTYYYNTSFPKLGWVKVEGKFQQIYSGAECVLALAGNRDIYYRANVFEREEKVCR